MLDNSRIAKFPSNGMVALEKTLTEHRAEAVTLARGYEQGGRCGVAGRTPAADRAVPFV
jgi:hypothetical protein